MTRLPTRELKTAYTPKLIWQILRNHYLVDMDRVKTGIDQQISGYPTLRIQALFPNEISLSPGSGDEAGEAREPTGELASTGEGSSPGQGSPGHSVI